MTAVHRFKKKVAPPPMTGMRFVDEFYPTLKRLDRALEMDFSFVDQAVFLHDMRTPSAIQRHKLYTVKELMEGPPEGPSDFEEKVRRVLALPPSPRPGE
jgi:hypothetical protein